MEAPLGRPLEGQVAIVTGASRGIGRATALALAGAGAKVVVGYAARADAAEEVAAAIAEAGGEALPVRVDVSDYAQVEAMVEKALERFGRVDILVNNAGVTRDNLLMRLKEEDWETVLDTNLKGAFYGIKAVSRPMLKARRGRIINVTSVVGLVGNPGQANYCAAKAGLVGLTKSAARELASRNITVNAVAPGYIVTDMTEALPEAARQAMVEKVPLGRAGRPEDVAGAILFLASPLADYITGQVIVVDGGMTM